MITEKELLKKIIKDKQTKKRVEIGRSEYFVERVLVEKVIQDLEDLYMDNIGPYKNRYRERVAKSKMEAYEDALKRLRNILD